MIDFGQVARYLRELRAADDAEAAGRLAWIEAVKRRLGLITPDDDAAARLRQWEHDHLTTDDLPVALCAGGRELDTSLTLELCNERVSEVRSHPWIQGSEILLFRPPPEPMFGPEPFRALFPEPVKCPGCTATMYPGTFDPSCHYSFCSIAHPPMPPMNLSVCL